MKDKNKHGVGRLLIYTLVALVICVALGFAANASAATVTFPGGSATTTNFNAWGGIDRITYDLPFNFAAGPTTIELYGMDMNNISYQGTWGWPPIPTDYGAQARFGIFGTGFWSLHSLHSSTGPTGGFWDSQSTPYDHDDGARKYLIQNQWSGTTVGVTVGNHQYNKEAFIPRTGAGTAINDPSQVTDYGYNTFDMKITYTPLGGGVYDCNGFVRMHKSAAQTEMANRPGVPIWGSPYTWRWNYALSNEVVPGDSWRPFFDGNWQVSGDLTKSYPFVEIMNWGVTQIAPHTFSWDYMVITGTPAVPSIVWVDDDWAGSSLYQEVEPGKFYGYEAFSTIQAAVDAVAECGTVYVNPGTYVEQVSIRNKSLKLIGDDATIQMPTTGILDIKVAESTQWYKYLVGIWGYDTYNPTTDTISGTSTITVEMSGFTLDANNLPPGSGYRYATVLCRNVNVDDCDGIANIHDNELININVDGRETFGILGYGDMDIIIESNTIDQFGRGGIGLYSGYAEVKNNIIIGPYDGGTAITWAPNGIQFGYGASGLIQGNDVTACGWPGTAWSGTGIMTVDTSDVLIDDNYVHSCEQAIGVIDFPECLYGASWAGACSDITVTNNIVENNEWGIAISNEVSNILVEYNQILNTLYDGIDVSIYGTCVPPPTGIEIHCNVIDGSGADGLWVETGVTETVDAECNYWGDLSGPSGDGPGTGDTVIGNADYDPWIGLVVAEANGPYTTSTGLVVFDTTGSAVSNCCGAVITYAWTFGDGATDTVLNPTHQYTAYGTFVVTFTITVTDALDGYTYSDTDTTTVTVTGSLSVNKQVWNGTAWVENARVVIGTKVPFRIIVTNLGQIPVIGYTITDYLSLPQFKYLYDGVPAPTSASDNQMIWTLPPGGTTTIRYNASAIHVCYGYNYLYMKDPRGTIVGYDLTKVKVVNAGQPALGITTAAWDERLNTWNDAVSLTLDKDVTFKITVSSTALSTITDVTVSEILPSFVVYKYDASLTPTTASDNEITWNVGDILPGDEVEIIFTAKTVEMGTDYTTASATSTEWFNEDYVLLEADSAPAISLLYPVGGETLKDTVTILWSAYDLKDNDNLPIYMYFKNSADSLWTEFPNNPYENIGSLTWDTTQLPDGRYQIEIITQDSSNNRADSISNKFIIKNTEAPLENLAPVTPITPSGQGQGKPGFDYTYATSTSDPEDDQIYYLWDWGDGTTSEWLGPYNSGDIIETTHTWTEKGTYSITVKAKDVNDHESDWSDPLPITMPYTYRPLLQFLENLFERFPNMFPILRQLLGY